MTTSPQQGSPPPVNLFRRLLAILYDSLLLGGLLLIAGWIALLINGGQIESGSVASWLLFTTLLAISFTYFGWFWIHGGQTLGMKTWRIRLHRTDGWTWLRAMIYFVSALLSWSLAGLGFLIALFHPQKKTLHDLLNRCEMQDLR
jgi:uncharacterized RDD family membrane protein YckC